MKTEFQKCMDGEIFDGKDKELAEMTLKTKRLLVKLNSTDYADTKQKEAILREMFGHLGENVHVDIDFRCEYGKNIFVGNKVIINMNCTFVDNNRIEIGNNVLIASNVQIYTATQSAGMERVTTLPAPMTLLRPIVTPGKIMAPPPIHTLSSIFMGSANVLQMALLSSQFCMVLSFTFVDCVAVGNPCRVIKHMNNEPD